MHRVGRTGRPPLTERRKAATRLDIAREAVRLFTTRGVAATSADEIADAAGISVRTLWRYFPNKESCVWPLLAAGIESTAQALRSWSPSEGVAVLVDLMQRTVGDGLADTPAVLDLIRLTRTEPSLRGVAASPRHRRTGVRGCARAQQWPPRRQPARQSAGGDD